MHLFEATEIDKYFANHRALSKVSIHVPQGSIYGLLGPNGAGKTTLIRIINRITAPDSGELFFKGRKFRQEDVSSLGYLPEERGLYKKMKVGEQALYLARLKGLSRHDAMQKLKHWFQKFEIEHWWNTKVEELSKGMAQKVQFIVTVLHNPELLIFDEPFSGFDPVNAAMLKKEVLELRKQGTTIIFSTHDMASVEELCDHITLIDRSEAILEGSVTQIKQQYKSNVFELVFCGNSATLEQKFNGTYTIIQQQQLHDDCHKWHIQLPENKQGNDILNQAVDTAEIKSFREILPSMNDVFIRAVKNNIKTEVHE